MEYKEKVEHLFDTRNTKEAWRGLKILTGMEEKKRDPAIITTPGSAERLNIFYSRFDDKDFSKEQKKLQNNLALNNNNDFTLDISLVNSSLSKIKINKAPGPDRLSGKLIKYCHTSLLNIIHKIFEMSITTCTFPAKWKIGEIVPIAKKNLPKCDNDLRPVTLTDILSKCLERVILSILLRHVEHKLDPLQFAYVKSRSTNDAIATTMHRVIKHLDENPSNTARVLFIDYSSAFNTIQPHLMIEKLGAMDVPKYLQLWILDFLTNRVQYVRTHQETSSCIILNTGAPQGCVLSPVLFVLYTNDLRWNSHSTFMTKYADDTIIAGLVTNDNDSEYMECIDFTAKWCKNNYLDLNVSKTKEIRWDFRRNSKPQKQAVVINGTDVDKVDTYKYLGLTLDSKFTFAEHVHNQCVKANRKMYFVRSLAKVGVKPDILSLFFNTIVTPSLLYASVAYYGLLSKQLLNDLEKYQRICKRLSQGGKVNLDDIQETYTNNVIKLANQIKKDPSHPLFNMYELLPSGRRHRMPRVRTNRFINTFIPTSIKLLNECN